MTALAQVQTDSAPGDIAGLNLEARAAALVNPASGLANDYLNTFNEVLMLIDLLPEMPSLADDVAAWRPIAYRDYFARSTLVGRQGALAAYDGLDPRFRAAFERASRDLARAAQGACARAADLARQEAPPAALARVCAERAAALRQKLRRLTALVDHGDPRALDDPQARVERIFDAA